MDNSYYKKLIKNWKSKKYFTPSGRIKLKRPKLKSNESSFRLFLEITTGGYLFPKKHPKWLKGLELDGYNKELKIAFEYQGPSHYQSSVYFQSSVEEIKKRDKRKRKLCRKRGVLLLIVSYTLPTTKWKLFIRNKINNYFKKPPKLKNVSPDKLRFLSNINEALIKVNKAIDNLQKALTKSEKINNPYHISIPVVKPKKNGFRIIY